VQPRLVVGLWNNFRAAAANNGWAEPAEPLYFMKSSGSLLAHGAPIPVPAAYIHRGDVSAPTGLGHWLIIIGDPKPDSIIVNDPLGEPDLIGGRTLNTRGAGLAFSRKNFGRRWMVESAGSGRWRYAPGKGWAIIAKR
jgi:hypothetical protein